MPALTLPGFGQPQPAGNRRYLVTSWTTESGLPQNSVITIVQTRDGYLWLGTFGGLVRFDGIRFTVFDPVTSAPGLNSNRIVALYEDRSANLWIGTEHAGLARYSHGRFRTWTTKDGLPDDLVGGIAEDGDGTLWVTTPRGPARFVNDRFETVNFGDAFSRIDTWFIRATSEGSIWLATDAGLVRYHNRAVSVFRTYEGTPIGRVIDLKRTAGGSTWITSYSGIFRFQDERLTRVARYKFLSPNAAATNELPNYVAHFIFEIL